MSTETATTVPAPAAEDVAAATGEGTAATGEGTEYGDKRAALAYHLFDIGAYPGIWSRADDDERALYLRSADVVLQTLPFLLWDDERERLAPLLPALEVTPEGTGAGERGRVASGDPESLECVCGNCAVFEEWISSTAEGIAFHPSGLPVPDALADALAAWPQDTGGLHRVCRVCGRVYRDATIRDTNTAPVVRVVELGDGTRQETP